MVFASCIPQPNIINAPRSTGPFEVRETTRIVVTMEGSSVDHTEVLPEDMGYSAALYLADTLRQATGYAIPIVRGAVVSGDISFRFVPEAEALPLIPHHTQHDAYSIAVHTDHVGIIASYESGAFCAVQTLRQLFQESAAAGNDEASGAPSGEASSQVPGDPSGQASTPAPLQAPRVTIFDEPRFAYRGLLVDIARSFISADELKQLISHMAMVKLNVLHLHLADDQGWRVEITNEGRADWDTIDYTRLTRISSETALTPPEDPPVQHHHDVLEDVPEGIQPGQARQRLGRLGYLTQQDYRAVAAFARAHHVQLIPEVPLPTHCTAALHAIPELNDATSTPPPAHPSNVYARTHERADAGQAQFSATNPHTLTFLRHVLTQLADMDPYGHTLHVGGITTAPTPEYTRLMDGATEIVRDLGRVPMCRSHVATVLPDPLNPDIPREPLILHHWQANGPAVRAAIEAGGVHLVGAIDAPSWLGNRQADITLGDPATWYAWDPARILDDPIAERHILGIEAPLWNEMARSIGEAEQSQWHALLAGAEVAWTNQRKRDWDSFSERVQSLSHQPVLKAIRTGQPLPQPPGTPPGVTPSTLPKPAGDQVEPSFLVAPLPWDTSRDSIRQTSLGESATLRGDSKIHIAIAGLTPRQPVDMWLHTTTPTVLPDKTALPPQPLYVGSITPDDSGAARHTLVATFANLGAMWPVGTHTLEARQAAAPSAEGSAAPSAPSAGQGAAPSAPSAPSAGQAVPPGQATSQAVTITVIPDTTIETVRLRIDLAYDGLPYHGFAKQYGVRTVQGDLEEALYTMLRRHRMVPSREHVDVTCAGRTDAGVHAAAQTTHVNVPADWVFAQDLDTLRLVLGKHLQPTIAVWAITQVPDTFSARFSATARHYRYLICDAPAMLPTWRHNTLHMPKGAGLDIDAMHAGVQYLVGEHDFATFCKKRMVLQPDGTREEATLVRAITYASVSRLHDGRIGVHLSGKAFCHQMVRAITGSLIHVGLGAKSPAWMGEILEAKDRARAASVAPPHGLTLVGVDYGDAMPASRSIPPIHIPS